MDAAKIERSIGGRFEQFFTAAMMTPIINPLKIDLEDCRWGIPVNFIGDSGVGKTERIKTLGAMIGQPTWTIYSSTKSPEHFAGVFVPSPDGEVHVVCGLPQVKDALCFRGGIIFLDEVSCASSSVQAALLSFVNERQVGEYALPNRTRIVLAMNPADIAAHGQELEIPLANRMAHFPYQNPTPEQWGAYMCGRYRPDVLRFENGEARVKGNWFNFYPTVANLAAEFMLANGGSYEVRSDEKDKDGKVVTVKKTKLHNRPDPEEPQSGGAWPSHRTWSWAMFGVTTIRCLGLDPKLEIDMVECLVGPALATEWASYCAKVDLPSPMEAMSGTWKIPRRIDIVRATMNSCVDWVLNRKDEAERLEYAVKCWVLIKRVMDSGNVDIVVDRVSELIKAGLGPMDCQDRAVIDAADVVCSAINATRVVEHIH